MKSEPGGTRVPFLSGRHRGTVRRPGLRIPQEHLAQSPGGGVRGCSIWEALPSCADVPAPLLAGFSWVRRWSLRRQLRAPESDVALEGWGRGRGRRPCRPRAFAGAQVHGKPNSGETGRATAAASEGQPEPLWGGGGQLRASAGFLVVWSPPTPRVVERGAWPVFPARRVPGTVRSPRLGVDQTRLPSSGSTGLPTRAGSCGGGRTRMGVEGGAGLFAGP